MGWRELLDKAKEESLDGAIAFLKYHDYCRVECSSEHGGIFDESIPGYLLVATVFEGNPDLAIYKKDELLEVYCKAIREAKEIVEEDDETVLDDILAFDFDYLEILSKLGE